MLNHVIGFLMAFVVMFFLFNIFTIVPMAISLAILYFLFGNSVAMVTFLVFQAIIAVSAVIGVSYALNE